MPPFGFSDAKYLNIPQAFPHRSSRHRIGDIGISAVSGGVSRVLRIRCDNVATLAASSGSGILETGSDRLAAD